MKRFRKRAALFLALVLLTACATASVHAEQNTDYSNVTIRLAVQYGMHYAPVYVAQQLGLLEKLLPGVNLEWKKLGGGSAMNEALISGQLDMAFMGIPPALIAIDKGVDYRIACATCVPPAELLVKDGLGIATIADIKPNHKIAVPSVGSIQHIMLAMAAEKFLGNPNALDNNLVAMANPDAYTALVSGTDIVSHFASMPYIDLEVKDGMKSILTAEDALGSGASIVGVATKAFFNKPELYSAVIEALKQAMDLINGRDAEAVRVIAETEKITMEAAKAYLDWPGTVYSTDIYSLTALGEFMHRTGYIKNAFPGFEKVTWEGAVDGNK